MNSMFDNEIRSENPEENIQFHYSREHRLENAPQNVRDYYNGNFELQKGFKVLFKNKTNRFLLIALVVMTAFALIYTKMSGMQNRNSLGDYKLELSSFAFEDRVYTTLKISDSSKKELSEKDPVVLDFSFSAMDVNNQMAETFSDSRLIESKEDKIQWLITDFDIVAVKVTVSDENKNVDLETDVKR